MIRVWICAPATGASRATHAARGAFMRPTATPAGASLLLWGINGLPIRIARKRRQRRNGVHYSTGGAWRQVAWYLARPQRIGIFRPWPWPVCICNYAGCGLRLGPEPYVVRGAVRCKCQHSLHLQQLRWAAGLRHMDENPPYKGTWMIC